MATPPDAARRIDVFLRDPREVFHSIEHRHEIWKDDPFDVEEVHAEARAVVDRLLQRAATPPRPAHGHILMLLGDAGAGKTHLVRAFRNRAHRDGLGFVGYMQMTTGNDYGRYLLTNLIDSLEQPYYQVSDGSSAPAPGPDEAAEGADSGSSLDRLAGALAKQAGLPPERGVAVADESGEIEYAAADRLLALPRFAKLDLDVLRALLFYHRGDFRVRARALKYLRCEDLSAFDRRLIGDLPPRLAEDAPARTVEALGRLMAAVANRSLILCIDQLEDMFDAGDEAEKRFRFAMTTLRDLADRVPSSVFVVCCLTDLFDAFKGKLTGSLVDRITTDPKVVHLRQTRTLEEVRRLIGRRLTNLFDRAGLYGHPDDSTFPFPEALIHELAGMRTRDVIERCRRYRDECMSAGKLLDYGERGGAPPVSATRPDDPSPEAEGLLAMQAHERRWNDFFTGGTFAPPESEAELAELLAWAITSCGEELESGHRFATKLSGECDVEVEAIAPNGQREHLLVSLCERSPKGGGFSNQVQALRERAGKRRVPVVVRSAEFPKGPATKAAQDLGKLIAKGGRRALVSDVEWRTMIAFRQFWAEHAQEPHAHAWMMAENHLSRLHSLSQILALETLERLGGGGPPPADTSPGASLKNPVGRSMSLTPAEGLGVSTGGRPSLQGSPETPPRVPPSGGQAAVTLGQTSGVVAKPLVIEARDFCQHGAFLGGSGSGKTTLAFNIIEQLLAQGVPAILVDRKGDLAAYARASALEATPTDPVLAERVRRLRSSVEVCLFTPGRPDGRDLGISVVPRGLDALSPFERKQALEQASDALGGMLGYKATGKDKSLRAVLAQAIKLLDEHYEGQPVTLSALVDFVAQQPLELVEAIGHLETKLLDKLVQDLETLKLGSSSLFAGESLDPELLLGLGPHARADRTRLSIVSTRFLGDNAKALFWVSQLLLSLQRWAARGPSSTLQAALFLDEADVYLPAQGLPATKGPLLGLLRRARSAGLSVLLATQSPGDLDYTARDQIRNWFVGRITQKVAIEKMRPLFNGAKVDVSGKLPGQTTGEFFLLRDGAAAAFRSARAAVETVQLPEAELVSLAAALRAHASNVNPLNRRVSDGAGPTRWRRSAWRRSWSKRDAKPSATRAAASLTPRRHDRARARRGARRRV